MDKVVLICCGETVVLDSGPVRLKCPQCGTDFAEAQIVELQTQEISQVPLVDLTRACSMLNKPADWINARRTGGTLEAQYGVPMSYGPPLDFAFPIEAVRRLATAEGLTLTPRSIQNGVLSSVIWIDRQAVNKKSS